MKVFNFKRLYIGFILFCIFGLLVVVMSNIYVMHYASPFVYYDVKDVPKKYCAIVLGAGAKNGRVSKVLRDRIEAAVSVVKQDKATRILVTGDHGTTDYDEVNVALSYIKNNTNIKDEDVFLDHAGFSTYESAVRAKKVFMVQDCVVLTQSFHAHRAVFLFRKAGIDCVCLCTKDLQPYLKRTKVSWYLRETLARTSSVIESILKPSPRYLGNQIPITGNSSATRD